MQNTNKRWEKGRGGERRGGRRRWRIRERGKSPTAYSHSLAVLLLQFCLILKMVHLPGINPQFWAKLVEIGRIRLAHKLHFPMTAAMLPTCLLFLWSLLSQLPSAAPTPRKRNELQNDQKRITGKIRLLYPKSFMVDCFLRTDALTLHSSEKRGHSKLIGISFLSCSHLSYVSLYV